MSVLDNLVVENQILELETFELTMNHQLLDDSQWFPRPSMATPGDFYFQLLGLYLIKLDLISAKFLWKRIPLSVKTSYPNIELLWNLGRLLWQKDWPNFFISANCILEDNSQPECIIFIVKKLMSDHQEAFLRLIESAYSCISADYLSRWFGLSEDKLLIIINARGWKLNASNKYYFPNNKKCLDNSVQIQSSNTELMSKLAEFMCFIENH